MQAGAFEDRHRRAVADPDGERHRQNLKHRDASEQFWLARADPRTNERICQHNEGGRERDHQRKRQLGAVKQNLLEPIFPFGGVAIDDDRE